MTSENRGRTVVGTAEGRGTALAWGTPFLLGLVVFVAGVCGFIANGLTSLASILLFGTLLAVAGVVEIGYAFKKRRSGQFLLYFLAGVLSLVVGAIAVTNPLESLAAVTLLLAGYFFASGIFRGITSVLDRYEAWGWDFFSGVVSVVLGAILVRQWPLSSVWLLGVLVSVELVTRGAMMMALALALRRVVRTVTA